MRGFLLWRRVTKVVAGAAQHSAHVLGVCLRWIPLVVSVVQTIRFRRLVSVSDDRAECKILPTLTALMFVVLGFVVALTVVVIHILFGVAVWAIHVGHYLFSFAAAIAASIASRAVW